MAKQTTGTVTIDMGLHCDGVSMTGIDFWNKWCPEGAVATSVYFYHEPGWYDQPDQFFAIVTWEKQQGSRPRNICGSSKIGLQ